MHFAVPRQSLGYILLKGVPPEASLDWRGMAASGEKDKAKQSKLGIIFFFFMNKLPDNLMTKANQTK